MYHCRRFIYQGCTSYDAPVIINNPLTSPLNIPRSPPTSPPISPPYARASGGPPRQTVAILDTCRVLTHLHKRFPTLRLYSIFPIVILIQRALDLKCACTGCPPRHACRTPLARPACTRRKQGQQPKDQRARFALQAPSSPSLLHLPPKRTRAKRGCGSLDAAAQF